MSAIADLDCAEMAARYRRHELSPVEVMRDVLARIERHAGLNAFVVVDADRAFVAASESETRWRKGAPLGPLDGIPATIKDNIWVKGLPTRRGSRTSDPAPASEDSPAVARLREQGAVILGKTAMPEHGWIGVCHRPLTGITRNPCNPAHTPGGSTGGGAVAARLGLGLLHLGTDGAGSLRIPAAFTGVFGMKPSFGQVPVYPALLLNVLSHQGPITRTVADAARMLSVIAGPDARDMAAWNTPAPDFFSRLDDGVRGLRIAWSPRLGSAVGLDPEIEQICSRAAHLLGALEVENPLVGRAHDVMRAMWWPVAMAIVDAVPADRRAEMDPGFLAMAERGRAFSVGDYLAAYTARAALHEAMRRFHQLYDLLVTPSMPITAPKIGREMPDEGDFGDDWLNWSPYTYPFNLTQQPAASVPCGFTKRGMPVGLQIVGPARGDLLVLRAARTLEMAIS